jgi:hypothetical protein
VAWAEPREGSRGWMIRKWLAGDRARPEPEDRLEM